MNLKINPLIKPLYRSGCELGDIVDIYENFNYIILFTVCNIKFAQNDKFPKYSVKL